MRYLVYDKKVFVESTLREMNFFQSLVRIYISLQKSIGINPIYSLYYDWNSMQRQ